MNSNVDIRALALPGLFQRALMLLIGRMFGWKDTTSQTECLNRSRAIVEQVFGHTVVFGQFVQISGSDVREAMNPDWHVSASSIHELLHVISDITPWTPVCEFCNEFALSSLGGVKTTLGPGSVCPFCRMGTVVRVPVLLRRVHWVTGQLIDPELTEDFRSRPGFRIPLTSAEIVKWVGDPNPNLLRELEDRQLTLDRFLAYVNVDRRMLARPEDAATLLRDPAAFGITPDNLSEIVDQTRRFVAQRELWNVHSSYLSDGSLRHAFWPMTIDTETYLVDGLVGRGAKCDVFRGRWDHTPTQFVIIKVLVSEEDRWLFDREVRLLQTMESWDDSKSEYYRQFVPKLYKTTSVVLPDGTKRLAIICANTHQFDWTFEDVRSEYPRGVHPRHAVWMMNRALELLDWLWEKRIVHGSLTPDHLLVRANYHRVMFIDWSYAGTVGSKQVARSMKHREFYPQAMRESGHILRFSDDLVMACRSILYVLGGDPVSGTCMARDPDGVNIDSMIHLLFDHAGYDASRPTCQDARQFKRVFAEVAGSIYGARRFLEFHMPARKA